MANVVRLQRVQVRASGGLSGLGGRQKPELQATPLQDRLATPVVVAGAAGNMGRAVIRAVNQARGLQLVGAVDVRAVGEDSGTHAGCEDETGLPIVDDILVVLGSAAQQERPCVYVDFSAPDAAFENSKHAMAFGLRPVVGTRGLTNKQISKLSEMADKSSLGCVVAPSFSIGLALLQQAAQSAAFHYKYAEIVESLSKGEASRPSLDALETANSISGLGRIFNADESNVDNFWEMPSVSAESGPGEGVVVGDGVRVHSLRSQGKLSTLEMLFSGPHDTYTIKAESLSYDAFAPGVLLAIRKVVGLKGFVYGIETMV